MNIYSLLERLAGELQSETDRKAAKEVIRGLEKINAFGSAARSIESETQEESHKHRPMAEWDKLKPGKLHDICVECGVVLSGSYDPAPASGNSMYFRR